MIFNTDANPSETIDVFTQFKKGLLNKHSPEFEYKSFKSIWGQTPIDIIREIYRLISFEDYAKKISSIKEYDLKIILVNNKIDKQNYIQKFQDYWKIKVNKYGLLIIKYKNNWDIYGYDNKNKFKEVKLESSDDLVSELDRSKPRNITKIIKESIIKLSCCPQLSFTYKVQPSNQK
ncbi:MAG: hypothetical protein H7A23_09360 [Leptospiraceae bacterium]|nr:hypothetical protein [Leptospiraceae bacterium]